MATNFPPIITLCELYVAMETRVLIRSGPDCKASFFCKFATELRPPLIDVIIWDLRKILRMNGQNLTKGLRAVEDP